MNSHGNRHISRNGFAAAFLLMSALLICADAIEKPPKFDSPVVNGIQLTIRLSDYDYHSCEKVLIECWLRNRAGKKQRVCIFPFQFTLAVRLTKDGKNVFDTQDGYVIGGDFDEGISDTGPRREGYVELRPGEIWRISLERLFIPIYTIIQRHAESQKLSIGPGDYTLTLRFNQKVFNGSEYGLKSWTGTIESNTIPLRILPEPSAVILLNQLKSPLPKTRARAAAMLGKRKDSRAIPQLIEELKHSDAEVRLNSAAALGMIGDKRATEPLITALNDENRRVGEYAAAALAEIGDKRAVEPLLKRLTSESPWIRRRTIEALGAIKARESFDAVTAGLKDGKRSVRYAALQSLSSFVVTRPEGRRFAARSLITAATDEYFEIRGDSATALAQYGDIPGVQEAVMRLLKDDNSYVREKAVIALEELRPKGAAELLSTMLEDPAKEVREAATEALRTITGKPTKEITAEDEK